MTRVRYLILALCFSMSFVLYLHRYTWGWVKEFVRREYGWDTVTLGWMDGLFSLTYGIGSIPSGIACDWFGARLFLVIITVLWSLSLGWTSIAGSKLTMSAARLALGLTQSGCYPTLGKISKNWFPLRERTMVQALIATVGGRLGGAASVFVVGAVLMDWCGLTWRWSLGVLTLLGVVLATATWLFLRNSPREHPWSSEQEAKLVVAEDPVAVHSSGSVLSWRHVLRSLNMWLLLGRAFLSNLADFVFVYHIPTYFLEVKPTNLSGAAMNSALPLVGGAAGGLFSAWLQGRIMRHTGNRRWARSSIGFTAKFLAMCLILGMLSFDNAYVIAWMLFLVKFFGDWEGPVTWGTLTDIGGKNSATVFGWINTMGSLAAVFAGFMTPLVIKWFSGGGKELTVQGYNALFVIMALEFLGVAVIWLFVNCTVPIEPEVK